MDEQAKSAVIRRMAVELAGPGNNSRLEIELRWIIETRGIGWYAFPEYMPADD